MIPEWLRAAWVTLVDNEKKPITFKNIALSKWKENNFWNYFTEKDLEEAIKEGYYPAIWCKASGILAIDIDSREDAKKFFQLIAEKASDTLKFALEATFIEKTPHDGCHILFKLEELAQQIAEKEIGGSKKFGKIELLYDHLVTVWSVAKENYRINYPNRLAHLNDKMLKELMKLLSEFITFEPQKEKIKEEIKEGHFSADPKILAYNLAKALKDYYVEGRRHFIVVAILGAMWQYGYNEETRIKTIEEFVKLMGDEEAKQRVYQAKYHNAERLKQLLSEGKKFAVESYLIKHAGLEPNLALEIAKRIRKALRPLIVIGLNDVKNMQIILNPSEETIKLIFPNGVEVELEDPFKKGKESIELNILKLEKKLMFQKAILSTKAREYLVKNWKNLIAFAEVEEEDVKAELLRIIDQEGVLKEKADLQELLVRKYPIIDIQNARVYFLGERLRDVALRYGSPKFRKVLGVKMKRTTISISNKKIHVWAIPFSEFGDLILDIVKRKQENKEGENECQ